MFYIFYNFINVSFNLKTRPHSINDERIYKVGDKIIDYGCRKTFEKCGTNMIFKTVSKILFSEFTFSFYRCYQRCSCINGKYFESDGQCMERENLFIDGSRGKTQVN